MYQNKENSYTDARITTTLLDFVSAKTDNHAAAQDVLRATVTAHCPLSTVACQTRQ